MLHPQQSRISRPDQPLTLGGGGKDRVQPPPLIRRPAKKAMGESAGAAAMRFSGAVDPAPARGGGRRPGPPWTDRQSLPDPESGPRAHDLGGGDQGVAEGDGRVEGPGS